MGNTTVTMEVTPQEAVIIENIRTLQAQTAIIESYRSETQVHNDRMKKYTDTMKKYTDMDDNEFISAYAEAVGDDVILSVLQDTVSPQQKWEAIFDCIDEDVLDELFEAYVSVDYKREMFLETQDREELCAQMVDLEMDEDWTPEN
jgi:hypothetical protein